MIEQGEGLPPIVLMTLVVPDPVPPIHLSYRWIYDEAISLLRDLYVTL
jgi:hypothetical protein